MRWLPAALVILALIFFLSACHRTSTSQTNRHVETSTVTDTKTSETGATTTTTTTTEAPGKTVTVTEEFGPPEKAEAASTQEPPLPSAGTPNPSSAPRKVPRHGPLVKRTITTTTTGGETTTTHQEATTQASGATETKAAEKSDVAVKTATESKPAVSCAIAGWLWGALIIVGVVGLLVMALKLRRAA